MTAHNRSYGTVLIPSPEWKPSGGERRCRQRVGMKGCGKPSAFLLNRGYRDHDSWWGYCADHIYGHVWLEDGMYLPVEAESNGLVPDEFTGDEEIFDPDRLTPAEEQHLERVRQRGLEAIARGEKPLRSF